MITCADRTPSRNCLCTIARHVDSQVIMKTADDREDGVEARNAMETFISAPNTDREDHRGRDGVMGSRRRVGTCRVILKI